MKDPINQTERQLAMWLKKQVLLSDRQARTQGQVARLQDTVQLTKQVEKANKFMAELMAQRSKTTREDTQDVRPD
jgi:hypothetical protein